MPVLEYESAIEGMLHRGRPFSEIEHAIEQTPLPPDEKDVLWLLAWSYPETGARRSGRKRPQPSAPAS
jgi:hypothetical protein